MQARASQCAATRASRPFAAATARRINARRASPSLPPSAASSTTPLLPPPSRLPHPPRPGDPPPPQQPAKEQPEAPPPPQLRQLYSFAPPKDAAAAGASASAGRSAPAPPAPLLAGTLPPSPAGGDDGHRVYFEVRGNPRGLPALVLHGGPGAGSYPSHARFLDPARYCVVLFDQRGSGRSTPLGRLRGNTAAALVADAERLRRHLGVARWACVLGGSWGACLALQYALERPASVRALVLRAVCTMRPGAEEVGWLYRGGRRQGGGAGAREGGGGGTGPLAAAGSPADAVAVAGAGGAGALRPGAWAAFLAHVGMAPEVVVAGREDPLPAYYARLLGDPADPEQLAARDAAASAWMAYEWAVYSTRAEDQATLSAAADAQERAAGGAAPARPPLPPDLAARGLAFPGVCPPGGAPPTRADYAAAQALLLCHYSLHGGFVNGDQQGAEDGGSEESTLLARLAAAARSGRLAPVASCAAFHGASDAVCPPSNARDLQRAWPQARVRVLPGAVGHSMYDPALVDAVVRATDAAADGADAEAGAAAAAAAAAGGGRAGAAPLRALHLAMRIEEESARRDAELASAAAALARAA